MIRPRSAVNRTLLTVAGAVLLVGDAWLASTAPPLLDRLPAWWPTADSGTVLFDRGGLAEVRGQGWWTPTVLVVTSVVLLAALVWAAVQLRRGGPRMLSLTHPQLSLRTHAVAEALAHDVRALPSVAGARVRVRGRPRELRARIRLSLEPDAEPRAVLRRLHEETIAEARTSAAPRTVHVEVRIGVRTHRTRRIQ